MTQLSQLRLHFHLSCWQYYAPSLPLDFVFTLPFFLPLLLLQRGLGELNHLHGFHLPIDCRSNRRSTSAHLRYHGLAVIYVLGTDPSYLHLLEAAILYSLTHLNNYIIIVFLFVYL